MKKRAYRVFLLEGGTKTVYLDEPEAKDYTKYRPGIRRIERDRIIDP